MPEEDEVFLDETLKMNELAMGLQGSSITLCERYVKEVVNDLVRSFRCAFCHCVLPSYIALKAPKNGTTFKT